MTNYTDFTDFMDFEKLEALEKKKRPGEPSLLVKLADIYQQESKKLMTNLNNAVNNKSKKDIQFFAHSLKSSSRTVGARDLANSCEQLEFYCRQTSDEQFNFAEQALVAKDIHNKLTQALDYLKSKVAEN